MLQLPTRLKPHLRMPMVLSGQRVGLFGGSFNPPHDGHVHVAELALHRLKLDQVWWIVTPGNPLKDHSGLAPLADRLDACLALANNPSMKITAFEASHAIRYTADTLGLIRRRHPSVELVWVMGADNLGQFHKWDRWRYIANTMPIAVVDRPGSTMSLHSAQAAQALAQFRKDEADSSLLAGLKPPAWTFLHGPRSALSSTAIRRTRQTD